ncbi:MAG: hypothetical protein LBJ17_08970 [Dysgonamonadaceae bacterium]|jgi:hypothetical protein|nr:hypothetical protein [Dysgonamonadaceae bacterium]
MNKKIFSLFPVLVFILLCSCNHQNSGPASIIKKYIIYFTEPPKRIPSKFLVDAPLYSSNRLEQAEPYYNPILAFMPRRHYYSEKIAGIPEGVIYPVGIGSLGIETTFWGNFVQRYSNASYFLVNMASHFYRTYDTEVNIKYINNNYRSFL